MPVIGLVQVGTQAMADRYVYVPLVGICLGMQLLMTESHEFGHHPGLGIVEGEVFRMKETKNSVHYFRVPQVGWNRIHVREGMMEGGKGFVGGLTNGLLTGVEQNAFMYFVHSYYVECNNSEDIVATCNYGNDFTSVIERDNIMGVQFHPEKSHSSGKNLCKKFNLL